MLFSLKNIYKIFQNKRLQGKITKIFFILIDDLVIA